MSVNDIQNEEIFEWIFPVACKYMGGDSSVANETFIQKAKELFPILLSAQNFRSYFEYISIDDFFKMTSPTAGSSEDLSFYLDDCDQVVGIFVTLGIGVDNMSNKLQHTSMSDAVLFDALASAFLEYKTNEFEESLFLGPHTFRFAPGYGDIPLALNTLFIDAFSLTKRIGICKTGDGLMLPQKSMITFCGIGKSLAPVCGHCPRKNGCSLRKENLRCFSN